MDTLLSEVLVFELVRAEAATGTVASPAIIITLDIIKHRLPYYFPVAKMFSVDTFHFQRVEEAFHTGIIVATTLSTHATLQVVLPEQELIIRRTVLPTTVSLNNDIFRAFPSPLRHL